MTITEIIVPKTIEAMQRLDYDQCVEGDLFEISFDINESKKLWDSGLWTSMNRKLNLLIDTYEEEEIFFEMLDDALIILEQYKQKLDPNAYTQLKNAFSKAKFYKTQVYIVM